MGFDMHAGDRRESIGHHEEFLFSLAQEDESRYPELLAVWHTFYNGPRISWSQAGALVHELIDLLSSNGGLASKPLANTVVRLLPFFSAAHRTQQEVRCSSD
ncbi:MAG: hypothetical protein EOP84_09430 [Verrucomicrobiaceae bacterium]|nr:MAG: hypothetical protein EOP84_09430 [Verrucomicrobiaceae bacterium]